jgi:CubicO group peptidase (beta-lactamase class C family)
MLRNLLSIFLFLLFSIQINSQVSKDSDLYKSIFQMDSLLFEGGFNNCELDLVETMLTTDFEFYHDQNGVQDKSMFMTTFKESLCSTPDRKPIRKLVNGSMEVFPMYNEGELYGAIQEASHEFYIREPGIDLYKTSVARFTHLWIVEEGIWKLKRSLSFDHQNPGKDYGPQFEASFDKQLFTNDAEIEQLLAQHNIPSLGIGYIEEGELRQIRVFGEKSDGRPAKYNTIYKVASLTKPIAAIVTLKLVEGGLWDLDEPVSNYFVDEDVKNAPELKLLTTRLILSHQSGFPNWRYLNDDNKLAFEFEPGSKFQYSGEGYEYLRKALEAKFNKGLEELAEELLFDPLGMKDTHFYWSDEMDEAGYALSHDEFGAALELQKHTQANAAANLLTTVQDYSNFMAHIINGAGLSDSLYQQFITPHSQKQEGMDWGLGCQLLLDIDDNEEYVLMHGGGDYGLKTLMVMLPNSKKGLLILTNSENGMIIWRKLIEEYLGETGEEIVRRNLSN